MSNASSSSDRDELYKNWIKGGLGLKYVKNGVTKYVVDTVNKQHADFLKTVPCVKCTSCKLETLQPAHTCTFTKGSPKLCPLGMKKCLCLKKNQMPCPNNFCGAIHDEIVKSNRYRDPNWSNTDICKWSSEPWEVAKCFINNSGYADKTTAEETDCSGILSIICNNFEFPAHLEQIAKEVKSTRNEIMHAPNLEVENTVLKQYLTNMEDLLASIPPGFPEVTSAITDIQMLNKTAFITPKDEKEMRLDAIKEFQIEKDRIIQELQTKEREISALTDQSKSEINDELNVAKTNIETETNASIKELHKDLNSNKDLAIQEMNKSKQGYTDEIKSTANKALSEISESKTEALQLITHQTRQTKDSLTELHVKHKDVEMKLDGLEQTLFTEQKNVKILSGRTDVIEEKQKLMEANISKLNSKHTDSPNELSTLKKELGNLDQKMDALVSLEDKEELRADLFEYYQKQFSNMCVSPGVSCPLRLVGNILYQTTEIEPDVDEESENLQIEDTEDEMNNLVTDNKDLLENSYKSVFYKENKQLNSVLLVGKSRKGKTAWCWNLLQKWVNSCLKMHENEHVRDGSAKAERDRETAGEVGYESLKDDEMFLCKFDVVIYLPLRYVRDLPNCITIAELMQNCLSVPLYQNKEKVEKLQRLLKSNNAQCLILIDDIHLWSEILHVPNMAEMENCWLISTSLLGNYDIIECEPKQFERYARIQFANKYEIKSRFVEQYAIIHNVQVRGNKNQIEQIDMFFNTQVHLSGTPVLLIYMMSYWFQSGCIENTLAANFAAMLDFLVSLAEDIQSENKSKIETLSHSLEQPSNTVVKIPGCFEKFQNLKKHINVISKYGNSVFNRLFELDELQISENEHKLLAKLGMITYDDENKRFQSLTYSLDMFFAALYMCMKTNETEKDALIVKCAKYFDQYTKMQDSKEFIFFLSCIDPKIENRLSVVLDKKMTIFEEKDIFFGMDFGDFAPFDEGCSTVENPKYTEKISLNNDQALHLWQSNVDHVSHVSLEKELITKEEVEYLKQSQIVASVTWHLPYANKEKYDLKLVSEAINLVQSLTVLILDGGSSSWVPYCTETQDIDLSKCRGIQHLDIINISCRKIAVNSDSLKSISVCRTKSCAITILHTKHVKDETQVINSQCDLRHIRVENLSSCKLDIFPGPKDILSIAVRGCLSSNILIRFPSNRKDLTRKTLDAYNSRRSECFHQNVEIINCRFTKLIYFSERNQREPLQCQEQSEQYVSIGSLLYQQNTQSGVSSNMNLRISQLILRCLSDDSGTKPCQRAQDENEPDINENVDVENVTEVNLKSFLLSLKQMQSLHSLSCEYIDPCCWEYLGMVLPELPGLREFSVTNEKDIPVSVIKSMKRVCHLNKFVIDGSWQGSVTKSAASNKRQLALKELCRILPELGNIDKCDINNLHYWPKRSLSCLKSISFLNYIQIQVKNDDEIEIACSILQKVQKLTKLTVECLTEEDVSELILCLQHIKDLEDISFSGITFSDCFPDEEGSLDLTKIRSFKIDCLESEKDIPSIIRYVPNMVLLRELTIHAILSDESWTLLASGLPSYPNLQKTNFTSSLHRLFPIEVVQSLGKNVNLRKVTLTFPYLSGNWSKYCECISHLREISSLKLIFSSVNEMYIELSPLKGLIQLKEFSVVVQGDVKPNSFIDLEEVLFHLHNLEILELSSSIRCSFVVKALKHLANLQSLYLPDFTRKEWIPLGQILPYLSKLENLEIAYRDPLETEKILSLTGGSICRYYKQTFSPVSFHS